MPTYQYRCKECSHELEELQRFSDPALVRCPACGKDALVRVIGGAGLVFKGSGFYLTDYKNKSSSDSSSAAPSKSKPGSSGDGSAGSKDSSSSSKPSGSSDNGSSGSSSSPKSDS